jgi:hypothetical protein
VPVLRVVDPSTHTILIEQAIDPAVENPVVHLFRQADQSLQDVANKKALDISLDLIQQTGASAKRVSKRLSTVFRYYTLMLVLTFSLGIGGFVAALFSAFVADPPNTAATITFAGLSAASFASTFVRAPTESMERLGPNTAWLLAIVNTYWTKLAYFNDSTRAAEDLERADQEFAASMKRFIDGRLRSSTSDVRTELGESAGDPSASGGTGVEGSIDSVPTSPRTSGSGSATGQGPVLAQAAESAKRTGNGDRPATSRAPAKTGSDADPSDTPPDAPKRRGTRHA